MGFGKFLKKSISPKSVFKKQFNWTIANAGDVVKKTWTGKQGSDIAAGVAGRAVQGIFGKDSYIGKRAGMQMAYERDDKRKSGIPGASAWIGRYNTVEKQIDSERQAIDRAAEEAAAAKAAHDLEVKTLAGGASDEVARRRRKGVYSSVLTGGSPMAYGSPASSSKTYLGQ